MSIQKSLPSFLIAYFVLFTMSC